MIATLFSWVFTFLFIAVTGFVLHTLLQKNKPADSVASIDQFYFLGFAFLTITSSWISIFAPINYIFLITIAIICTLAVVVFKRSFVDEIKKIKLHWKTENRLPFYIIGIIIIVLVYSASAFITLNDTGLYHTQNILWIQKFKVIPGLGNLHGRFAFNSHFFPISAIFSFNFGSTELHDILIYPLNGVSLLVLLSKLVFNVFSSIKSKNTLQTFFYSFILFPCLALYPSWINSPSPDIICAVLTIYALIYFIEGRGSFSLILLTSVVLVSITIKLSVIFLALLVLYKAIQNFKSTKSWEHAFLIPTLLTILVLTPFFVRNYYLSGYLVYPMPSVDVFNPDWKIPAEQAIAEKNHVSTWAKVPLIKDEKVMAMPYSEWMPIWFNKKPVPVRGILILNALSIIWLFIFILKKQKLLAFIQTVIILNLIFWFFNGPDPRFVHGFLFVGVGLAVAAMSFTLPIKIEFLVNKNLLGLAIILLTLVGLLKSDFKNGNIIYPGGLEIVETYSAQTNFTYHYSKEHQCCNNTELPCAQEKNDKLRLRGKTLESGFKQVHD